MNEQINDQLQDKFADCFPIFCALTIFLLGWYSFTSFEALSYDGARWLHSILDSKDFILDTPHLRYSNILLQTPAVFFSKLPFEYSRLLSVYAFCFSYSMAPFIAYISILIPLRREGKKTECIYLAMFFLVTALPALGFPTNSIMDSSYVFSVLVLGHSAFYRSKVFTVFGVFGLFYMAFSHSLAVLYLISLTFYYIFLTHSYPNKWLRLISFWSLFIKLLLTIRLYLIVKDSYIQQGFIQNFENILNLRDNQFLVASVLLVLISSFQIKKYIPTSIVITFLSLSLTVAFRYDSYDIYLRYQSFSYRAILPLVGMVIMLAYILQAKLIKSKMNLKLYFFFLIICFDVAGRTFKTTRKWDQEFSRFRAMYNSLSKKCLTLQSAEWGGGMGVFSPNLSVILGEISNQTKLIFTAMPYDLLKGGDYCKNFHENSSTFYYHFVEGMLPSMIRVLPEYKLTDSFRPYVFKRSELQNCNTPNLYSFEDENRYIEFEENLPGKWKLVLNLRTNEFQGAQTKLKLNAPFMREKLFHLKPGEQEISLLVEDIGKGSRLSIKVENFRYFDDNKGLNSTYYLLKCLKLKKESL